MLRAVDHNYIIFIALLNEFVNLCERSVLGTFGHVGIHDFLDQHNRFLDCD